MLTNMCMLIKLYITTTKNTTINIAMFFVYGDTFFRKQGNDILQIVIQRVYVDNVTLIQI